MIVPSTLVLAQSITQNDVLLLIGIVVLIFCSAFCSASETAYSSINSLRLKTLAEEKKKGSGKAIYITENFEKTLSCILTFNNLVNIACTTIAGYLFAKFVIDPTIANLLNTVVLTIVILIFGEILPKAKAKANSEKYALRYSGAVYFLLRYALIYYPFYLLQKKITKKNPSSCDEGFVDFRYGSYLTQPTLFFFVAPLITKRVPIIRAIEMGRTMYQLGMKPAST